MRSSSRLSTLIILLLTLLAFALRVLWLDKAPPGFSDDELSNAFVISGKILAGDWRVYYTDASGHEALFHLLAAGTIRLFGFNVVGIRLMAAIFGTLTVPLTYRLGQRLFSRHVGLVAAAGLTVSFWSLLYSRDGQRHIAMPFFMLLSFLFLWRGMQGSGRQRDFIWSGLAMGLGFYTYFAARGVPAIVLAFAIYLALAQREMFRRVWRGIALSLVVAGIVVLPLVLNLRAQAEVGADARVTELAVPIQAVLAGDFAPLWEHVRVTLSMFHSRGDREFLYNIPDRPVFSPLTAALFWFAVALALFTIFQSWYKRLYQRSKDNEHKIEPRIVFLLGWWFTGLVPGFLSVPPASLGHTIISQPATYMLIALPLYFAEQHWSSRQFNRRRIAILYGVVLFGLLAARDLPDYFNVWPNQGQTRFLFHADQVAIADELVARAELTDVAVSGLLAGPWDKLALDVALANVGRHDVEPRWYNPQRAVMLALSGEPAIAFHGYPVVERYDDRFFAGSMGQAGGYQLSAINLALPATDPICFTNNLCLLDLFSDSGAGMVELTWLVRAELQLPQIPIVSKPAPPGVYDGPRLALFVQLLAEDGTYLRGDDGLWVDPTTLQTGDAFRQLHFLGELDEGHWLSIGLYDPMTGRRIPLDDGSDSVRFGISGLE